MTYNVVFMQIVTAVTPVLNFASSFLNILGAGNQLRSKMYRLYWKS